MPQWRKLHTKIVESLDFHEMPSDFVRLVWVLLPLGVDREGRALDNAALVKSHIMPLRDDVATADIDQALAWFAERGMIVRYQVKGRLYFLIPTFHDYQGSTTKEAESQYPAPLDQVLTDSRPTPDLLQTKSGTDVDVEENRRDVEETDFPQSSALAAAVRAYENTVGLVSGAQQAQDIADMVGELENRGVMDWWETAVRIAADQNKRSWAYVRGILTNCLREGRPPLNRGSPAPPGKPQKRTVTLADGTTVEAIA